MKIHKRVRKLSKMSERIVIIVCCSDWQKMRGCREKAFCSAGRVWCRFLPGIPELAPFTFQLHLASQRHNEIIQTVVGLGPSISLVWMLARLPLTHKLTNPTAARNTSQPNQ